MDENKLIGKRLTLIHMNDDPNPIPDGSTGIIRGVGLDVIHVCWDNLNRSLGVIMNVDQFDIED